MAEDLLILLADARGVHAALARAHNQDARAAVGVLTRPEELAQQLPRKAADGHGQQRNHARHGQNWAGDAPRGQTVQRENGCGGDQIDHRQPREFRRAGIAPDHVVHAADDRARAEDQQKLRHGGIDVFQRARGDVVFVAHQNGDAQRQIDEAEIQNKQDAAANPFARVAL